MLLCVSLLSCGAATSSAAEPGTKKPNQLHFVTSTGDNGSGTLRAAILAALASDGPDLIRFDEKSGLFAGPQTIRLAAEFPEISSAIEIDGTIEGRLWEATGVTLSGAGAHRIFTVGPAGALTLRALSLADGAADVGGAILSDGRLVLSGVTATGNRAGRDGGAVALRSGSAYIVNTTFAGNRARARGGAIAILGGAAAVVHATIAGNAAASGGALYNAAALRLANSILADSQAPEDCVSMRPLEPTSGHNLIEAGQGCGIPLVAEGPRLGRLGLYNGPTPTIPLEGGSPAINVAANDAALDEGGRPLSWDQRGNGDPRFVAGIADLGAFEVQYVPDLQVDTARDADLRGCSPLPEDCSLRGAIALANADPRQDTIRFSAGILGTPLEVVLRDPLPTVDADLRIVTGGAPVTLRLEGGNGLPVAPGVRLQCEAPVIRAAD